HRPRQIPLGDDPVLLRPPFRARVIAISEKTGVRRVRYLVCGFTPTRSPTMITKLSHTTVYVLDQDVALAFYRDKLGLEVRTDATMDGGFRWLTVGPKTQPDMEIALMK